MTGRLDVRSQGGAVRGSVELDPVWFSVEAKGALMHQVVTAQLAAARSGTHNTKTRAEVAGGGAKPYRQKGTGRARQGSLRAPHYKGGGIALGPKPRSYRQRTPKKMVRQALRGALSDRVASGHLVVVDEWSFEVPSTKQAQAALQALGVTGRAMVVLSRQDEKAYKSFRNIPWVDVVLTGELATYDVLCADWLVFSRETLPGHSTWAEAPAEGPAPAAAPAMPGAEAQDVTQAGEGTGAGEDVVAGESGKSGAAPAEAGEVPEAIAEAGKATEARGPAEAAEAGGAPAEAGGAAAEAGGAAAEAGGAPAEARQTGAGAGDSDSDSDSDSEVSEEA